ncbi:MAG: class I SAM-dependent methyltransferase [Hyphomicrobiaceae bacterium]
MHDQDTIGEERVTTARGLSGWRDEAVARLLAAAVPDTLVGRIRLTLPSGRDVVVGGPGGAEAAVTLRDYGLAWKAATRGAIGFADAYVSGAIETRDLAEVLRFFIDNRPALARAGRGLFSVRLPDRLYHRARRNTRAGSRRNIAAHYDLGNAFYAHWLDAGMSYSSGIYRTDETTLQAAQAEKNRALLAALDLQPGQRLLEIGCGWGGLAEAAGRLGAGVSAVTVSAEQEAYARRRIAAAGLDDQVAIRFEDYRDITGTFDRIASVEMIEAVGEERWPLYFRTLRDRLTPGGVAVLQAITIREQSFEDYRRKPDFIQRYIFPGGMLPTKTALAREAASNGLSFEIVETFAASYARTLAEWRQRFEQAWPEIQKLGFDERFRRLWTYYLVYCQVGFEQGVIDVGFYRFTRPQTAVGMPEPTTDTARRTTVKSANSGNGTGGVPWRTT